MGCLGSTSYITEIQLAVVTKQGDKESAKKYLSQAYKNIKRDNKSEKIIINDVQMINLKPVGKNSVGYQMVVMNLKIKYLSKEE